MFPQTSWFYGTLRQLQLDVSKINDLSRLRVSFEPTNSLDIPQSKKAKWQDRRPTTAASAAASSAAPAKGKVGSFAWAVKDEGDFLTVGYTKYAKKLILEKLNLQAGDICLSKDLSWKGAEPCPCSTQQGREDHDSTYHRFTEAQLAPRTFFEEEPYRLPMEPHEAQPTTTPAGMGAGKGRAAERAGQGAGGRAARK